MRVTDTITRQRVLPRLVDRDMDRAHDVGPAFKGLRVSGLKRYPERTLLLPGTCYVPKGVSRRYLRYLMEVGLGAPSKGQIVEVATTGTLLEGVAKYAERLKQALLSGNGIEFFLPTPYASRLIANLGLDYADHVWGPRPDLAALANDKAWLREFAAMEQLDVRFPEHVITTVESTARVEEVVADYLARYKGAVIKHPSLASGDGISFIHPGSHWRRQTHAALRALTRRGYTGKIVIEAAHFQHVPFSTQLEVTDKGPRFLIETEQLINNGVVHSGNILSSIESDKFSRSIYTDMANQSMAYATALWRMGYRGYLGFDFILAGNTVYMIEANGRVTGAMYPLSVGLQLSNNGVHQWSIVTDNLHPDKVLSFTALRSLLTNEGLLFGGEYGILPVAPGLLKSRKLMCYSVAEDEGTAKEHLRRLRRRVENLA